LPLELGHLAEAACYSPYHFHRLYHAAFGETPQEHLARKRLELARRMLVVSDASITTIVFETGYESVGSFSHRFRMATGFAPTAYRAEFRRRLYPVDLAHLFVPHCFMSAALSR